MGRPAARDMTKDEQRAAVLDRARRHYIATEQIRQRRENESLEARRRQILQRQQGEAGQRRAVVQQSGHD